MTNTILTYSLTTDLRDAHRLIRQAEVHAYQFIGRHDYMKAIWLCFGFMEVFINLLPTLHHTTLCPYMEVFVILTVPILKTI